ncbi:hypothetical protein B0H14DRAFT_2578043 [Mycena olivaceomarginata]|nr:hypothetical protein B0H14DRAFT_2578043 [Mycena olivaceomarginata]
MQIDRKREPCLQEGLPDWEFREPRTVGANSGVDGAAQLAGRFHGPNATKTDPTSLLFSQTDRVKTRFQRLSPGFGSESAARRCSAVGGRFHGPNTTKTDPTSLLFSQTDRVKTHFQRLSPGFGANPQIDGAVQFAG